MADLSELQTALPVKLAGSDSTGQEDNFVNASANGDLQVADGIKSGGVYGNLALTTANTALEAKVGASRLANRKLLTVHALDAVIYWGYDSSVTVATGTPIFQGQMLQWSLKPTDAATAIYVVCATASKNARITEAA